MPNPNTSNKRVVEYLKSNPEYRKYAIAWLRRRKHCLRIRYKDKYKKMDYNLSVFELVKDIFWRYKNWAKENGSVDKNENLYLFLSTTSQHLITDYYRVPFEVRVQFRHNARNAYLKCIIGLGYPNLYSVD